MKYFVLSLFLSFTSFLPNLYGTENKAEILPEDLIDRLFEKAEQGNARAQFNLAQVLYEQKQDFEEATKYYELAALQGHMRSQYGLALLFHKGEGVKQDYAEAKKWYLESSNQGYYKAQFNLGTLYYDDKCEEQSFKKAFILFSKAANQGYAKAQYMLGNMYYYGEGVERDFYKSWEYYRLAANQRHLQATIALTTFGN